MEDHTLCLPRGGGGGMVHWESVVKKLHHNVHCHFSAYVRTYSLCMICIYDLRLSMGITSSSRLRVKGLELETRVKKDARARVRNRLRCLGI